MLGAACATRSSTFNASTSLPSDDVTAFCEHNSSNFRAARPMSKDGEGEPLLAPVADDGAAAAAVAAASRKNRILITSFLLLVVSGLGNKVFQKLMTEPMQNYPYTLSQLITFVYIPVSFAYIWPMLIWGKEITPEQRAIPWYKWAIMGCLDGLSGIMASFAVNYIPCTRPDHLTKSALS